MSEKRSLGGLKLSDELVQLDFQEPLAAGAGQAEKVLEVLSRAKVNIVHLHQGPVAQFCQTTVCCVTEEFQRIGQQVEAIIGGSWLRIREGVGTITLFPHGGDPAFPAEVLALLDEGEVAVYGFSTSVSALVIHTEFSRLDEVVELLMSQFTLPSNHAPLRPDFRLRQVEP